MVKVVNWSGKDEVEYESKTNQLKNICDDGKRGEKLEIPDAANEDNGKKKNSQVELVAPAKVKTALNDLKIDG